LRIFGLLCLQESILEFMKEFSRADEFILTLNSRLVNI